MELYPIETSTLYNIPQATIDSLGGLRRNIRCVISKLSAPFKGEYYLSGSTREAHLALDDMTEKFYVVTLVQIETVERIVKGL